MQWAKQLKDEYSKIAREKMLKGVKDPSTTLDKGLRTDESVAKDLDMGKTTYRKANYIYENGNRRVVTP